MTTPTPGSDPNYPQGGAPQGQPGWGAPQPPQGYEPAPSYQGGPAGYGAPAAKQPPQVLTAAILAFVVAFFLLLGAFAAFAFASIFGFLAVFGIVYLALCAVNVWGGVWALTGKGSTILTIAGAITAGLSLLGLIVYLTQGDFSFTSLISLIIGGAIIFLMQQPQSKQYFAARGVK